MTTTPPLTLYYIDTRPLSTITSSGSPSTLPLLSTLRPCDQTSITRFHQLQDQHMSLASTLLKHLFIHRTAKIPWSEVHISRTPAPHQRPFWNPATAGHTLNPKPSSKAAQALEFNVSHQAGLVVLAGCPTSTPPSTVLTTPDGPIISPNSAPTLSCPRIGIDITCVSEPSRRPNQISSLAQFSDWVDVFGEVFSEAEMRGMKSYQPPLAAAAPSPQEPALSPRSSVPGSSSPSVPFDGRDAGERELVQARLRNFYTHFALKEAYIKMTGEALLVPWLRELEFRNVRVPAIAVEGGLGVVERGVEVWFRGERLGGLRVELVGFEGGYVVAVVGKGLGDGNGTMLGRGMEEVDLERDVRGCAEGICGCLDGS